MRPRFLAMARFRSTDPTRTPRNSLIAAGLLVAVASVLIGFHGATMVLSAMSMTEQQPGEPKPKLEPVHTPIARAVPPPAGAANVAPGGPAAEPAGDDADRQALADLPPPTGVAAAAKARALAEMDAMDPEPEAEEPPRSRARRIYRAPRVDKHKVY